MTQLLGEVLAAILSKSEYLASVDTHRVVIGTPEVVRRRLNLLSATAVVDSARAGKHTSYAISQDSH